VLIPFNRPVYLGTELSAMAEAILQNGHVAGGGPFGTTCEAILADLLGVRTLLVSSCTHALEMAAILTGAGPGDEVIVPSFTFVSTANAFALRGVRPVFVDCDADGNVDVADVERARTPRTRAIVAMHYAGSSCDLDRLLEVAGGIPVVEDAAQALGSRWNGRPLGTFGACSTFSFHETKNVGCGEGGALALRDAALIERAEVLRDKGTNRRRFQQGLADKYTWVDVGSSWTLSDLNAAYLSTQLRNRDTIQQRRRTLHERYGAELRGPAEAAGARLLGTPPQLTPNHHLFALVLRSGEHRTRFIAGMRARNIVTPFHYVPLHQSPFGRQFHDGRALPRAEELGERLVRLPLFFNLSDDDQGKVIDAAQELLRAA
jgi:dTDP-4-amino-4,6-dideoxygalactose transaminase